MTLNDPEVQAALQRLDRALTPAPVLAAKAVERYYRRGQATPWINEHDIYGAPLLDRDAVLRRSEPNHAPKVEVKRRRRWWRR